MPRNYKFLLRKAHRYLGVFLGVQFLFWTAGGLYFSWTDIKAIRGDDLLAEKQWAADGSKLTSPQAAIAEIRSSYPDARPLKLQLVEILGEAYYEIGFRLDDDRLISALARASDGRLRQEIGEDEARRIASAALRDAPEPLSATYLSADALAPITNTARNRFRLGRSGSATVWSSMFPPETDRSPQCATAAGAFSTSFGCFTRSISSRAMTSIITCSAGSRSSVS